MRKKIISIVGTGGTIASKFDPKIGGHVSAASAEDMVKAVPELSDIAEIRIANHSNINSARIDTATVFSLRDALRKELADDQVAGAVVTHGTATLEETAYMMDLTLGNEKPVVITGAQRNFDEKDADGPRNLLYAVKLAAHPEAFGRGVLVAIAGEVHAAVDATKIHTQSLNCFRSRDGGPIGMVTKYENGVVFFGSSDRRLHLEVDHIKENVQLIPMVQGANDLLLRACIRERPDGIVVEGVGGGNYNLPFYHAVCDALDAGIPVVTGIRHRAGAPHLSKGYPGSFKSLVERGAISTGYLSGIKARILLMVALAYTRDSGALREIFKKAGGV